MGSSKCEISGFKWASTPHLSEKIGDCGLLWAWIHARRGVPSSISSLAIWGCPLLELRLKKGEDLDKISHIPNVEINGCKTIFPAWAKRLSEARVCLSFVQHPFQYVLSFFLLRWYDTNFFGQWWSNRIGVMVPPQYFCFLFFLFEYILTFTFFIWVLILIFFLIKYFY